MAKWERNKLEGVDSSLLRCFSNDTDTVVAENEDDAWDVWCEHTGESREDYSDYSFEPVPDDTVLQIWMDRPFRCSSVLSNPNLPACVKGLKPFKSDEHVDHFRLPASEWARRYGRGFLCSTEV